MADSIHIFDDFPRASVTDEERHRKRICLEPLVFDILKRRYWTFLDTSFTQTPLQYKQSKQSKHIVIIERRIHENFAFVLRNAAYFAKGWGIIVVCSDTNLEFCKLSAGNKVDSIQFMPIFKGNVSRDQGRNEYNSLLQSAEFYRDIPGDYICIMQMDSYLRKNIPDSVLEYDYIAAPFIWDTDNAGGGLSFRRLSAMIDVCERSPNKNMGEDIYISKNAAALGYKVPPFMEGMEYVSESCIYEDPVAVHQWWTYFDKDMEDAEVIFNELVRCDISI